jgi:phage terminase large subunit-like protein
MTSSRGSLTAQFSDQRAQDAIDFIEALNQAKGRWSGKPFELLDWQRERVIKPLFGTIRPDGTRQYRTCYVEVPRKNGKSTLAAAIALYLLCADGEAGAEVYSAAGSAEQASIVFRTAASIVRKTTGLRDRLVPFESVNERRIVHRASESIYRVLPGPTAVEKQHGLNASGVILDEAHTQPSRELYDVLVTSVGTRSQPVIFIITTAGYDRNSLCWELHEYARQVAAGIIDDPTFLPVLFGADEAADWTSPAVWHAANPSLDVTVPEEYLAAECAKAKSIPAYENTFRRLYLNQWTQQETRFLPMTTWDACGAPVDEAALLGRPCYVGLDLASTTDLAAMVLLFPDGDRYEVLARFWMPAETMRERGRQDRAPYDEWVRQGFITATEGNVIDYAVIERDINAVATRYRVRELAYDPWNATQLVMNLIDRGLTCTAVRQGYGSLSWPTKTLLSLVIGRQLRHGGNPVLRWMADNVMVTTDPAGNIKPDKAKSTQRIDGIVALVMAIARGVSGESGGYSVYDEREMLVL